MLRESAAKENEMLPHWTPYLKALESRDYRVRAAAPEALRLARNHARLYGLPPWSGAKYCGRPLAPEEDAAVTALLEFLSNARSAP